MTDYLINLTARSLNKAKAIRPRVPMRFESQIGKEPFYQKRSLEIMETTEAHDKKRQKPYSRNSSFNEDILVEPQVLCTEVKQSPISKSQTLQRARITNQVTSHQTQNQHPEQTGKLIENLVVRNEMIKPRQDNYVFSANPLKSKQAESNENLPSKQEPITIQPLYPKKSREFEDTDGEKLHRLDSTDFSFGEDIQVEPQVLTEVKQSPIFKSQILQRARITNQVTSHQTRTQQPEQTGKLIENLVIRNEMIEPRQKNYTFPINTPKLKRMTPNEYPHIPYKQEPITIKSLAGIARMEDIDEIFSSPILSKSKVDKIQKSSIPGVTEKKTGALTTASQYHETGRFESISIKTLSPEKRVIFQYHDPFTQIKKSGRIFTPEVTRKHSKGLEIDTQKTTAEEKSIQVTIGRIEIRAAPPDKPQKQHRAQPTLSLEDYSKRHTKEVY